MKTKGNSQSAKELNNISQLRSSVRTGSTNSSRKELQSEISSDLGSRQRHPLVPKNEKIPQLTIASVIITISLFLLIKGEIWASLIIVALCLAAWVIEKCFTKNN